MDRLDDYLVELIVQRSGLKDVLNCSGTCKRFNTIITCSTVIQLFLHRQLFGRSYPSTPHDLICSSGERKAGLSLAQKLATLSKVEHNIIRYKPHLRSYKIPHGQVICAIGDGYIVTVFKPNLDVDPGPDQLYSLATIWTPYEGELRAKVVKVDFKPCSDPGAKVVDVEDNVIICMQEFQLERGSLYRTRVIRLFNDGDIARPWPSDEPISSEAFESMLTPRIRIGRAGLLVMSSDREIRWTKWTDGREAKWGTIESPPYLKSPYSVRVYGHDIVGILGQCEAQSLTQSIETNSDPWPVCRDYLLIYKLNHPTRDSLVRPTLILRMPWTRNEYSFMMGESLIHGPPGTLAKPAVLANSNNGHSAVMQVDVVLEEEDVHPQLQDYRPWGTIDIPLKIIFAMMDNLDKPISTGRHKGRTRQIRSTRQFHPTTPTTDSEISQMLSAEEEFKCECCIRLNEPVELLNGVRVFSPDEWMDKAYSSYTRSLPDLPENPCIFGTRFIEDYRHCHEHKTTDGHVLTEIKMRNYLCESEYDTQKPIALGGMGKTLRLPKVGKDTGRLRSSGLRVYKPKSDTMDRFAVHTFSLGRFKNIPARGLIEHVFFDGEKFVFEHSGGWVTMLDFA
ncbi:uncharacterized protein IL334_005695 [Kwoniella shivajii]|uniref:F-box domain-containing protein n=1 Tax=Kwoniella shivajii TaxID=564305 RepID=A0ABZ1D497_9TREE|nr:hypothetical protein IL334_005695 [Kwoniella shivajii]